MFLDHLSCGITIGSAAISLAKAGKERLDQYTLTNLTASVDYTKIASDIEKYASEADEYITKHHAEGKQVISEDDRAFFIESFYKHNPECLFYKQTVEPYLNEYLDKLEKFLTRVMTLGEKFLNKRAADILNIVRDLQNSNDEVRNSVCRIEADLSYVKDAVLKIQTTLDESFTRIDKLFIEQNKIYTSSERERFRFEYFNVSNSSNAIFKAVINALSASTDEYESIADAIYETARRNSVLFMMADGGTGKSTLLCKVALKAADDGYKVFYCDSQINNKDKRIELDDHNAFFLLDNAYDNVELITKLYEASEKNPNMHVILCDRTYRIKSTITKLDIPGWIIYGKGIVLKNNEKPVGNIYLRKPNVKEIFLTEMLRKTLSDEVIESTIEFHCLDREIADRCRLKLSYTDRSVTDIDLEFHILYNDETGEEIRKAGSFKWDWDLWDEIPGLQGSFKYLAALIVYGVNVTVHQMERITGTIIDPEILTIYNVCSIKENGTIRLRHDTVADNFYKVKNIRPSEVIKELFEDRKLTESTVVEFERIAFSLSNLHNADDEIRRLDIPQLVRAFARVSEYCDILGIHQRIHSLEFAMMVANSQGIKGTEELCQYYRKRIGVSYNKIASLYHNELLIWIKYFFFSVDHAIDVPDELLQNLSNIPGLYKKVTQTIDKYIRSAFRHFDKEEKERWIICIEKVFDWITDNIDKDDIPSRILLLWIYQHSNHSEKARDVVDQISDLDIAARRFSEFSVAYIQTFENEVKQLVKNDRHDPRIRNTNTFIRNYYKGLLDYSVPGTSEYITVVRSYMRFLRDIGHFDEAYFLGKEIIDRSQEDIGCHLDGQRDDIRQQIVENAQAVSEKIMEMEEDYGLSMCRVYIEMGMICQNHNPRNEFSNYNESIMWFKKAIDENVGSERQLLYCLKPLCKSYFNIGNYDECLKLCSEIHRIDFRDGEARTYSYECRRLIRIQNLGLPVGEQFTWTKRMDSDEIELLFEKIISEMAEDQLAFVEFYNLRKYNKRFSALRAAFSIRNNVCIHGSVLSRIKVGDSETVDKILDEAK